MKGTHNTMTYARAVQWWARLAPMFWRCQNKQLKRQYMSGARCFDLRIRFEKATQNVYFCHGAVKLEGNVIGAIAAIASMATKSKETAYIRLTLEDTRSRGWMEYSFTRFCRAMVRSYPSLHFFGGHRKGDWKLLYAFGTEPTLYQPVGSMAEDARWYERFMPRAYARRKNRDNMAAQAKDGITIYDFL